MTISRSRRKADILIRDAEGYPIAVVEVKNLPNLTRNAATELRHNLIEYGIPARVPYFLLLSQDIGFLWKNGTHVTSDSPPDYEFPMDGVITRYLKETSERRLYESILSLIIFQWLNDLINNPGNEENEPEKTLALAGFNQALKNAVVLIEENI